MLSERAKAVLATSECVGRDKPLEIHYSPVEDVVTIEGIRYAGVLFRQLGWGFNVGTLYKVLERHDGVLTVHHWTGIEAEAMAILEGERFNNAVARRVLELKKSKPSLWQRLVNKLPFTITIRSKQ